MCGIIGIYNYESNEDIIYETYMNLKNLQHRGRDSYGFLFYSLENPILIKDIKKIQNPNIKLKNVNKTLAHVKYTTSYFRKDIKDRDDMLKVTQPFRGINMRLGEFYLVHNGNINDLEKVIELFDLEKEELLNDSHLLVKIIEKLELQSWEDIFNQIILSIEGSFSIIVLTKNEMYSFKDSRGYRPLCIGQNDKGYCFSSESVGLGNYNFIKELERGKIYKVDKNGLEENDILIDLAKIKKKKCLFEFIYFLNADSKFNEKGIFSVRQYRYQYGIELGKKEKKLNVNNKSISSLVIGAPMTGIPSGQGFADYLGYRYEQILVKNKNAGRSFILKTDEERLAECKKKFIVQNGNLIANKEIYFIDDSLVRGNTLKVIIDILKEYKPKKIHIRITSPKVLNICNYGIDIPSKKELIMNWNTNEEYIDKIGANSIEFLEVKDMFNIMGNSNFCTDCFNNEIEW